jgi:hypothetical protein
VTRRQEMEKKPERDSESERERDGPDGRTQRRELGRGSAAWQRQGGQEARPR